MENLAVVQALIRAGLDGDATKVSKQAERLIGRLTKSGDTRAAAALKRTLETTATTSRMVPSKLTLSRNLITGEKLSKSTVVPMDKEAGASLCQVQFPEALADIARPAYSDGVGEVLKSLLDEWERPESLAALGVDPTRTVLLYGPPGSGKTLAAQYLARQLGLPLITARIDGLISSFLGTTARNISNLFAFANRYQCVLLLDEFDAIAKVRNDQNELGEIKRVVNTLLQHLDDRKNLGLTVAITNHHSLLDPAVWRRFELHLDIGAPGSDARQAILLAALHPVTVGEDVATLLGLVFEGLSGADLERVTKSAKRLLALSGRKPSQQNVVQAFAELGSRLPADGSAAVKALQDGVDALAAYLMQHHPDVFKQTQISSLTGINQSKLSRLKQEPSCA